MFLLKIAWILYSRVVKKSLKHEWPRKRQLKLINATQCQFCVSCQLKYRSLPNTYLPIFCCWKLGWMRRPKHGYGESCRGEKSAMRAWSPAGSCRSSNILSPCLSPCQSHYPCHSPCLPPCLSPLSMSSYKSQCKSTDPHGVLMSVPISLPISSCPRPLVGIPKSLSTMSSRSCLICSHTIRMLCLCWNLLSCPFDYNTSVTLMKTDQRFLCFCRQESLIEVGREFVEAQITRLADKQTGKRANKQTGKQTNSEKVREGYSSSVDATEWSFEFVRKSHSHWGRSDWTEDFLVTLCINDDWYAYI